MSFSAQEVVFYLLAAATLVSAALVIAARNPINSAMSLVATFFFLAGLYVLLLAHTIAVLQVLVYAGAIMVLFLFVIMLLSLTDLGEPVRRVSLHRVVGALSAAGLLVVLVAALSRWQAAGVVGKPAEAARFGTLEAVGGLLYTRWIFPFEAVSLLLLVAMVGAVVVAKPRI
ncbi:MAG TPA: NADH-quinone oxidoreductase subunit J [Myxococcaceae bacterium]|nr:NADH-quinone oxidoreductase subunit J [Myxococcaceae bacterium]